MARHLVLKHGIAGIEARTMALSVPRGDIRVYSDPDYEDVSADESAFGLIDELDKMHSGDFTENLLLDNQVVESLEELPTECDFQPEHSNSATTPSDPGETHHLFDNPDDIQTQVDTDPGLQTPV